MVSQDDNCLKHLERTGSLLPQTRVIRGLRELLRTYPLYFVAHNLFHG